MADSNGFLCICCIHLTFCFLQKWTRMVNSSGHFTHKNVIGERAWHPFSEVECRANVNSLCSVDPSTGRHQAVWDLWRQGCNHLVHIMKIRFDGITIFKVKIKVVTIFNSSQIKPSNKQQWELLPKAIFVLVSYHLTFAQSFQKPAWCPAAGKLNLLLTEVWNVFFSSCLQISPRGSHSCNCDVLYIPLQCLTWNPRAERNSKKIPLSRCHKADECYCCRIQGSDLWKFLQQECHCGTNSTIKSEEFSFPYSLYLHGVDEIQEQNDNITFGACQHIVELFMFQHFGYYFFMATNCSLCQICRHDGWVFCINMHGRHALTVAQPIIQPKAKLNICLLLYCKMKSPFYRSHDLWIFLKICSKREQTGKLSLVIELTLIHFFYLN